MPVKFKCSTCQQRLSVGSSRIGQSVTCPRCKSTLTVPATSTETAAPPEPDDASAAASRQEEVLFPEFIIRDDHEPLQPSWTSQPNDRPTNAAGPRPLLIPRHIVYLQGILLAAVAILFFIFGMIVGGNSRQHVSLDAQPCVISGSVQYALGNRQSGADEGSVVVVLPVERRPDAKADVNGLRVNDPPPDNGHSAVRAIRQLGGGYARVDREGGFRIRVPDRGNYYLLVISGHRSRSPDHIGLRRDLAQIGRYFSPAVDLLGEQSYYWDQLVVRADQHVRIDF